MASRLVAGLVTLAASSVCGAAFADGMDKAA